MSFHLWVSKYSSVYKPRDTTFSCIFPYITCIILFFNNPMIIVNRIVRLSRFVSYVNTSYEIGIFGGFSIERYRYYDSDIFISTLPLNNTLWLLLPVHRRENVYKTLERIIMIVLKFTSACVQSSYVYFLIV